MLLNVNGLSTAFGVIAQHNVELELKSVIENSSQTFEMGRTLIAVKKLWPKQDHAKERVQQAKVHAISLSGFEANCSMNAPYSMPRTRNLGVELK